MIYFRKSWGWVKCDLDLKMNLKFYFDDFKYFFKKILLLGVDKNASIYALSDQINSYKKAV